MLHGTPWEHLTFGLYKLGLNATDGAWSVFGMWGRATELSAFRDNVNSALLALQAWAPSYQKDKDAAMALLYVAEAWVCKGAAGRLDLPAC